MGDGSASPVRPAGEGRGSVGLFDVYKVVDHQRSMGQACANVYFYQIQSDVDTPAAQEVLDAWVGQVLPVIRAAQHVEAVHELVEVTNLFDDSDAANEAMSLAGTLFTTGEPAPNFNAFGIKLIGDNAAVRPGSKRLLGVSEAGTSSGTVTSGAQADALDDVCDILVDTLVHGIIPTFVPVIVKRLLVGGGYALPDALVDAVLSNIIDAVFNVNVTSQTSRKIGVGE